MQIFDQKPNIIRFIGDVHAIYKNYNELVKCEHPTIQVGDFGKGFEPQEIYFDAHFGKYYERDAKYRPGAAPMLQSKDVFIRGNHDSPVLCKSDSHWIPDGHIVFNMMFIGGADSIDKHRRKKNVDWWENEELSQDKLNELVDLAIQQKPAIMVTHECPSFLLEEMYATNNPSRTAQAFNVIWKLAPPKLWVFGHHHKSIKKKVNETLFICCDIDEGVDIDISKII